MNSRGQFVTRWRVRLGYPLALICFWLAKPSLGSLAIGAAVATLGLAIRGSAAGYLRKGSQLATTGPYARTRNPLYFGSVILAAGFAFATGSWIAAVAIAIYIAVFYPAVMLREASELRAAYGTEFESYASRVPLFFPSFVVRGAQSSSTASFSWAQYNRNREYQAAIGAAVALGVLAGRMLVRAKWGI